MKKQEAAAGGKAGSKEAEVKQPRHNLNWTVHLVAACRKDELDRLEKLQGVPRCVAMYRWDSVQYNSVQNTHKLCKSTTGLESGPSLDEGIKFAICNIHTSAVCKSLQSASCKVI